MTTPPPDLPPSAGGSYLRQPDGTLKPATPAPAAAPAPAAPVPVKKPADAQE